MSVCSPAEEESASEEPTSAPIRESYEAKSVSKVVRVLTVLAYLLSVSLAAILLSVYYICVWKSPDLPPLNETEGELSARTGDHNDYSPHDTAHIPVLNEIRRSNFTMNITTEQPAGSDNETDVWSDSTPPSPPDPALYDQLYNGTADDISPTNSTDDYT